MLRVFFVSSARRPGLSGLCCRSPRVRFVPFGALVSAEGSGGSCAAIHTVGGRSAREGRITPRQRRATRQPAHTHSEDEASASEVSNAPTTQPGHTRGRLPSDADPLATDNTPLHFTAHGTLAHRRRYTHGPTHTRALPDTLTTPDLPAKAFSLTFIISQKTQYHLYLLFAVKNT